VERLKATQILRAATVLYAKLRDFLRMSNRQVLDIPLPCLCNTVWGGGMPGTVYVWESRKSAFWRHPKVFREKKVDRSLRRFHCSIGPWKVYRFPPRLNDFFDGADGNLWEVVDFKPRLVRTFRQDDLDAEGTNFLPGERLPQAGLRSLVEPFQAGLSFLFIIERQEQFLKTTSQPFDTGGGLCCGCFVAPVWIKKVCDRSHDDCDKRQREGEEISQVWTEFSVSLL